MRDCHEELKKGWKNKKHIDSWLASMVNYVVPALGAKPVDAVTSIMVRDAMAPIWMEMPETAQRILQRIGAVLDFAHIKGWRPKKRRCVRCGRACRSNPLATTTLKQCPMPRCLLTLNA